ncbi:MAG: polysaccharide biosynthesis protein [Oscillospiraceae bacterium]|nr:polysaccharide biosynthesis protein [Oscillospiraceae bacterium]
MNANERKNQYKKLLTIFLLDCLILAISDGFAVLTRFEYSFSDIPEAVKIGMIQFLPVQIIVTAAVFWLRRMYHYIWRSVTVLDVAGMIISVSIASVFSYGASLLLDIWVPGSVCFIMAVCQILLFVAMRCSLRFYATVIKRTQHQDGGRIMIIGAGEAGRSLIHEIRTSDRIQGELCCVIDDNPEKWGKKLSGIPVLGGRDKIPEIVAQEEITQIIFAIPTATPAERRDILDICKMTKCKILVLPGIYQMVNGEVSLSDIKDVQVEDLLGREPVKLNMELVNSFLRDKVVMVTGGGGSIGSELCRQVAKFSPSRLIILDNYENNAYEIQQELLRDYGDALDLRVEIASVRDKQRTYEVVRGYAPDVIFHAAAHKHVPLMEACPSEAIKNNVFGTYHVVRAAEKFGVKKFVMISTDKAVNPTNFMGATKRFCEMILQSRVNSSTEFCAVRFGNVLGSNGSVVPLFKRQIEAGGPITLTDKRIIRYFMTIPEAAQLVLEAGAMAQQNQVFVLDMGEPVKILDLAENLIRLSGKEPYTDIQIVEVGLRPGEKLYEELLMKNEHLTKTENKKIFIEEQGRIVPEVIMKDLMLLDEAVTDEVSNEEIICLMKSMVPTYHAPEEVNDLVGAKS